ncbi:lantibiotic biosynthesis protein [Kitasatospora sp. NBC_01287]|uniref:lantibiotic dehydratase C-terminal domain-containing protein n=1 Tax=Kitasatospora sp. NBC_01287 TaxID=2903573 RepID=UPI00225B0A0B|nr:lantibiotic dehydratase C-terminal domain-containing protein [Kitasatospora sp. NBC_01287]MCX4745738.1 lantibiotic biosynthesis protein [Kitasatospora sp. NBC_01287]
MADHPTAPQADPQADPRAASRAASRATPQATPGDWQAFHVFYAASPRPLLLQCVRPLVAELTGQGLLAGYFFLNYWLEGPHLRLRLRPATAAAAAPVREHAEAAIAAFLRRRPALYQVKDSFFAELYETLFELEYREEDRARLLGPDGRMRLRPNNTFSIEPYEPEYGKYGGPAGVALAEWHFQRSSDLVIEATRSMNLHLRTVVLGLAAQLMMTMSACFLADQEQLLTFLDRYHAFWNGAFAGTNFTAQQGYDRAYGSTGETLAGRFRAVRAAVGAGELAQLPTLLRGWAEHCLELRARAVGLAERGELVFRSWDGERDLPVTEAAQALPMLLSPYAHMTNNRLSVTVRDEAYLSYVLARALREPAGAVAP